MDFPPDSRGEVRESLDPRFSPLRILALFRPLPRHAPSRKWTGGCLRLCLQAQEGIVCLFAELAEKV